jgi:hypothetical protein
MRTIYLGTNKAFFADVQHELAVLQAAHHSNRKLARAVRQGKQGLRRAKSQLAPILADLGFHFHGDAVRKFRGESG